MAKREFLVCSCGLGGRARFPLETLAALRTCGLVLSNTLDEKTAASLSSLNVRVRRLDGQCSPSDAAAALRRHARVGLVTYGNPYFLNHSLPALLRALPADTGVEVLPAVSSFDALVNLLGLSRIPAAGLLSLDLNTFDSSSALRREADTFLFAPFVLNLPGRGGRRAALLRAAEAAYPPGWPVYAIRCSDGPSGHEVLAGCVGCLDALLERCGLQHTLVIPSPPLRRALALASRRPAFPAAPACACPAKKKKPA